MTPLDTLLLILWLLVQVKNWRTWARDMDREMANHAKAGRFYCLTCRQYHQLEGRSPSQPHYHCR